MTQRQAFVCSRLFTGLAALVCLVSLPCVLRAQSNPSSAIKTARIKERDMMDREYALYHAGEAPPEQKAEQMRSVLPQIQEDFKQMQLVNNEMMQQIVAAPALDYKLIMRSVSEINKRAARLKENLNLLQIKESGEKEARAPFVAPADDQETKGALLKLDALIMSFINNPQFKDTSVIALQHANKAGRDLRDIIDLSHIVKKSAERLSKAPATTP